ncbi:MAG: hypothetical protein NT031_13700 [Planctomycetota bacterium]|nr:hypothetical protein [Planctomycetota bacterium]
MRSLDGTERLARRFLWASLVILAAAVTAVVLAALLPVVEASQASRPAVRLDPKIPAITAASLEALLERVATRELIRPAQHRAAVKDSGVAAQMAKALKLQKEGTVSVKKGQTVLKFLVKEIQSDRVTLSLEGVEVVLSQ